METILACQESFNYKLWSIHFSGIKSLTGSGPDDNLISIFNQQTVKSFCILSIIPGDIYIDIQKISMIARSDLADHLFPRHKGYFPSPPSLHYWGVTRNPLVHLLFWCKNHLLPHTAHCTHSGYDSSIPQHNITYITE